MFAPKITMDIPNRSMELVYNVIAVITLIYRNRVIVTGTPEHACNVSTIQLVKIVNIVTMDSLAMHFSKIVEHAIVMCLERMVKFNIVIASLVNVHA